ncbi:MAG: SlyX [Lacunisphaera sp.]|jgi:SlyX protein|nr:SlyX [Lacunisphaera sp.]MDB6165879.1 SlyX [Lacunisphaera sp.]
MSEAKRLTELEERYAHLQRHQTEQDKAMLELADEVAKLRKELGRLRAQVTGGASDAGEAADERPPHY